MATRLVQRTAASRLPRPFGKYTLLHRLAKGGMAELYLALQRSTAGFEKLIVIKRALPLFNQEEDFIAMLLHEARIAATLSHPNIVQIYDVGQAEGTYYIAMEHVHGADLRAIQKKLHKHRLGLPLEHAINIAIGLSGGLSYAHEKCDMAGNHLRIVHRDISPHNVLVSFSGDVKLVDFGVAKSRVQLGDQTRSGSIKGKIAYMSPEQALGQPIDARSDVFAIGTTLYELTTGRRLFKGRTDFETLRLVGTASFVHPREAAPDMSLDLEAILMRALAKYPEDRYQSARELQLDLEALAHAARLPMSALPLASFMRQLFAEELRDQEAMLAEVKVLADSALIDQPTAFQSEAAPPSSPPSIPGSGSVRDVRSIEPRAGQTWRWLAFVAALAGLTVAVGSSHAWRKAKFSERRWFDAAEDGAGRVPRDEGRSAGEIARRPPGVSALAGFLDVAISGGGCELSVDGRSIGRGPVAGLSLAAGAHTVECAAPAVRPLTIAVRIGAGETTHVGFALPP